VTEDEKVDQFTNELVQLYHKGRNILIHCWGGHGRTGTISAVLYGMQSSLLPLDFKPSLGLSKANFTPFNLPKRYYELECIIVVD